jgi:hypothetical protein
MKTDTVMAREAYPECSVPRMQRLGGVVAKGGWRGVGERPAIYKPQVCRISTLKKFGSISPCILLRQH